MKIMTVLKSGGEYKPEHVQALQRQCSGYAPIYEFQCLTDMPVPGVDCIPLKYGYPGWWSKLEMFRPDVKGDLFFMDLDTILVGPLDDILAACTGQRIIVLRDFYRDGKRLRAGVGSGLMYLPEGCRAEPWRFFQVNPRAHMQAMHKGDQQLLELLWGKDVPTWQDIVPGQVVSYKVHCCQGFQLGGAPIYRGVPEGARIICFHGQPRPFGLPQFSYYYAG